ncbi:MAG: hypothetical protein ACYCZD_14580 [Rhodanobacter sp.]
MLWKDRPVVDKPPVPVEEMADEYTSIWQDKDGSLLRGKEVQPGEIRAALQSKFAKGVALPVGRRSRSLSVPDIEEGEVSVAHQTTRIGV